PSPVPLSGSLLTIELRTKVGLGSQTSVTWTVAWMGTSLWFGGQSTDLSSAMSMSGGVGSFTVTVAMQVEALLAASFAVNVTGVVPSGKNAGALLVIAGVVSQTSVADTPAKNGASCGSLAAVPPAAEHSMTIFAGHTIAGGVVSTTVADIVSESC